jgi:hypothetical protein
MEWFSSATDAEQAGSPLSSSAADPLTEVELSELRVPG